MKTIHTQPMFYFLKIFYTKYSFWLWGLNMHLIYLRKIERNKTKQQTKKTYEKKFLLVFMQEKLCLQRCLFNFPQAPVVAYKAVCHKKRVYMA